MEEVGSQREEREDHWGSSCSEEEEEDADGEEGSSVLELGEVELGEVEGSLDEEELCSKRLSGSDGSRPSSVAIIAVFVVFLVIECSSVAVGATENSEE